MDGNGRGRSLTAARVVVDIGNAVMERLVFELLAKHRPTRLDLAVELTLTPGEKLPGAELLVIGTEGTRGDDARTLVSRLRERYPETEVFLVGKQESQIGRRFPEYAASGCDVPFEIEIARGRVQLIEEARLRLNAPLPAEEIRCEAKSMKADLPGRIAMHCLRQGYRRVTCERIADRFGCDRNGLHPI